MQPSTPSPEPGDRDAILDAIIDEAAESARRGEGHRVEDWVERYPEYAKDLRELLPWVLRLEAGAASRSTARIPRLRAPSPVEVGETFGNYRLESELGRGGMGVVYAAEQRSLGRRVALKILPRGSGDAESLHRRFELEARTAARLRHPHIVSVHDFGEHDGLLFYAMQLVEGSNLDDVVRVLRRRRRTAPDDPKQVVASRERGDDPRELESLATPLAQRLLAGSIDGRSPGSGKSSGSPVPIPSSTTAPVDAAVKSRADPTANDGAAGRHDLDVAGSRRNQPETPSGDSTSTGERQYFRSVARIGALVADALAHAHAEGVVHRDIKPSNLLLDHSGKIWVADFGLAKLETTEGLTRTGDAVGTLRYMSPERFHGWSDPRSDVYSLGATLYELTTLRPPFAAPDRASLIRRIVSEEPTPPSHLEPNLPHDLETIILKCLEKEAAQRYPGAADLREDLERFLAGRPILARRTTALERTWLFARRNPLISGLAVSLAVIAVVASVVAVRLQVTAETLGATAVALETQRNRALENLYEARLVRAQQTRPKPKDRESGLESIAEAARYRPSIELRDATIPWIGALGLRTEREVPIEAVTAVAPDGTMIAVETPEGVEVRDLEGRVLRKLERCLPAQAYSLEFSPDGRYLVRFVADREILRVSDGRCILTVPPGRHSFHPDLTLLATSSLTRTRGIREAGLYDLATEKRLPLPEWASGAGGIFYGPSGRLAAVVSKDGEEVRIVDVSSGDTVRRFEQPESRLDDPIAEVLWHPEERFIACGFRPLVLWNLESGDHSMLIPEIYLQKMAFSPRGDLFAARSWPRSNLTWIFDAATGAQLAELSGDFEGFRREGNALFLQSGRSLTIEAVSYEPVRREIRFADDDLLTRNDVSIDPTGRWLAVTRERAIVIEDLLAGRRAATLEVSGINEVVWREDGSELICAGELGVWRWPFEKRKAGRGGFVIGPPAHLDRRPVWGTLGISPGGCLAYIADDALHIRHLDDPAKSLQLGPLFPSAAGPTLSDDERFVACADTAGGLELRVWNLETGEVVWRKSNAEAVRALFIGSDHLLVIRRPEIDLVEVGTWKTIGEPLPGDDAVIGPDRRLLAIRGSGGTSIRLFAVGPELTRLATIEMPRPSSGLEIGPDRRTLAAGSVQGGPVFLWRLDLLRRSLRDLGLDWEPPLPLATERTRSVGARTIEVDLGELDRSSEARFVRADERVRSDPRSASALYARARAAAELERWEVAVEDGEASLRESFSPRTANSLAWWYTMAPDRWRDPERAVALAKQATAAQPGTATYWNTLGWAQCRRGAWTEAIDALERSLAASRETPYEAFDRFPLAIAFAGSGNAHAAKLSLECGRRALAAADQLEEGSHAELKALEREAVEALERAAILPGTRDE